MVGGRVSTAASAAAVRTRRLAGTALQLPSHITDAAHAGAVGSPPAGKHPVGGGPSQSQAGADSAASGRQSDDDMVRDSPVEINHTASQPLADSSPPSAGLPTPGCPPRGRTASEELGAFARDVLHPLPLPPGGPLIDSPIAALDVYTAGHTPELSIPSHGDAGSRQTPNKSLNTNTLRIPLSVALNWGC